MEFGRAVSRAEPSLLGEFRARRRNRRALKASSRAIVVQENRAAQLRLCEKRVSTSEVEEQARCGAAAARRRARRCRTRVNGATNSAIHIHVRAAGVFLLNDGSRFARNDRRQGSKIDRQEDKQQSCGQPHRA